MESVPVINFKKVVSMVVMLSLMLGACGKSPARRDDNNANINIGSLKDESIANTDTDKKDNNIPEDPPSEPGKGAFAGIGIGAGAGTVGVALGTAGVLTIGAWLGFVDLSGKAIVVTSLIFGASLGSVAGGIAGGISGAAGDGLGKVMLKTGGAGLAAGVAAGGTFALGIKWVKLKAAQAKREWQTEQDVEEGVLLCAGASYPSGLVRREEEETVEEWAERVQEEQLWEARVLQSHVRVRKAEARMRKAEERAREVQERVRKWWCMAIYEERTWRAEAERAREELERVQRTEKRWRFRLDGERRQARREAQERKQERKRREERRQARQEDAEYNRTWKEDFFQDLENDQRLPPPIIEQPEYERFPRVGGQRSQAWHSFSLA